MTCLAWLRSCSRCEWPGENGGRQRRAQDSGKWRALCKLRFYILHLFSKNKTYVLSPDFLYPIKMIIIFLIYQSPILYNQWSYWFYQLRKYCILIPISYFMTQVVATCASLPHILAHVSWACVLHACGRPTHTSASRPLRWLLSEGRQSAMRLTCRHHNRQDGHLQTERGDFEMAAICQPLQVMYIHGKE